MHRSVAAVFQVVIATVCGLFLASCASVAPLAATDLNTESRTTAASASGDPPAATSCGPTECLRTLPLKHYGSRPTWHQHLPTCRH